MKTLKKLGFCLVGALLLSSVSCMNTYDAYGNPRQTVDPAVATAGVAAAGLIGYAAGKNNRSTRNHHHHHHRPPVYHAPPHRGYYR